MRTAIDTNILSAIWEPESTAALLTDRLNDLRRDGPLVICGVVLAETLANPKATPALVNDFLARTGLSLDAICGEAIWRLAGERFGQYAVRRRRSQKDFERRILADFIIGAHAVVAADRLMTMDRGRYERDFPELKLV
jgi:predicted nucleic acid-binding protein